MSSLRKQGYDAASRRRLEILRELGQQLQPMATPDKRRDLPGILTAVEGTLWQAQAAGGVRDRLVPLGGRPRSLDLTGPGRVVELKCPPQVKRRPTGRGGPEQSETLVIPTNLVDLPADGMALLFQQRGTMEIFFRFYQHILGGRPLRSYDRKGIEWQT